VLIEADPDLCALVKDSLEEEGFSLTILRLGKGASDLCRQIRPDVLLMDIMLPDYDGLEICREIRLDPALARTPIVILTARASETDRIVGLEVGASDYMVKPFSVRELIARIKLQFRKHAPPLQILESGGLRLDRDRCQVQLHGKLLDLTATEFRLLECLMSRPGVVYRREQLLNAVWGENRAITDRSVDVYVMRLRQKIEKDPAAPVFIHAVRGFGYMFEMRT
jgi:DNA-binding response OmpR family regulator